jgi:3-dehydroquinate synthase
MLEHTFSCNTPASECRVSVGSGIADRMISTLRESNTGLIVAGSGFLNSWNIAFESIEKSLPEVQVARVEDGEGLKTFDSYIDLIKVMRSCRLDRGSSIAYFGGGTLGDLAGFCASTYMRGIGLIAFPTTLLAMVDSSLGGKNGIDLADGKNAVGTFYNPSIVMMDTDYLTKGLEHQKQGIAEMAKYGFIRDASIIDDLLSFSNYTALTRYPALPDLIFKCVRIKMDIVSTDPHEKSGKRELLNFGHTVGHAIERASRYRIPHGTAVMWGMKIESQLTFSIFGIKDIASDLIDDIAKRFNIEQISLGENMQQKLMDAIRYDKKVRSGNITVQVLDGLGSCRNLVLPVDKYLEALGKWLKEN